jgi:hypothetical protein
MPAVMVRWNLSFRGRILPAAPQHHAAGDPYPQDVHPSLIEIEYVRIEE